MNARNFKTKSLLALLGAALLLQSCAETQPGQRMLSPLEQFVDETYSIFLVMLLSFFAAGCGPMVLYSGPRLPREEVAVITGTAYAFGKALCIAGIDNRKEGILRHGQFEVLPGPHEIDISVADRSVMNPFNLFAFPLLYGADVYDYYGPVIIKFTAEAGRSYKLQMQEVNDGSWEVWIEDAGDHKVLDKRRTGRKPYMRSWDYTCKPLITRN